MQVERGPVLHKLHLGAKIAVSLAVGLGWLVFLIVWLYFFAENFSVYRNLAVFILSLLVLGIAHSVIWIPFGLFKQKKGEPEE